MALGGVTGAIDVAAFAGGPPSAAQAIALGGVTGAADPPADEVVCAGRQGSPANVAGAPVNGTLGLEHVGASGRSARPDLSPADSVLGRSHAEAAGEVDAHFARMPAPEASPKPSPGAEEATGAGEAPFADVASNSAARTNSSSKVSMPTSTLLESSAFGIADGDGPSEEIAFDTARHGATPAKQSEQESNLQTILYFIYSGHTASFSGT